MALTGHAAAKRAVVVDGEAQFEELDAQIEKLEKENQALKEVLNKTETQTCIDYCVQCNDGSTVWYGRSKNWLKAAATTLAGLTTSAGAVVVGAAAIGVGKKTGWTDDITGPAEETHTSWTGYLPTTGFSCEKVDVYKMERKMQCMYTPWMEKSAKLLGRVKNNRLKPYDSNGNMLPGYFAQDKAAYKDGCKAVKGAGLSGTLSQLWSSFEDSSECKDTISNKIFRCSEHSKLCGAVGVRGVTYDTTMDTCHKRCSSDQPAIKCPVQR